MSTTPLAAIAPHATGAYRAALEQLFARTGGGSRYGLERTRALLARIGDPHLAVPILHVAGTNGKGSTVATLTALLAARSLRVGRYTSPHLVDFRERIAAGGRAIGEQQVVEFLGRVGAHVGEIGATFFEVTTAMAFDHFVRAEVDVAVVETGLGGRLDSTNVVTPLVAGVTEIGLDHTELLGDSVEAIAREKAGIYKAGRPAVVGAREAAVRALLATHARDAGATPVRVAADETLVDNVALTGAGTTFDLTSPFGRARLETPLLGAFQADNAVTAMTMLDAAGDRWRLPIDDIAKALATVRLPGRFQRHGKWVFDVAHNPDGARVLAETVLAIGVARPLVALVAVLSDKDWSGVLTALAGVVDHFVLTTAPTAPPNRVWSVDDALIFARKRGWSAELAHDFDAAMQRATDGGATVLVTGSFHTVGDAMARLQVDPLAG